MHIQAIFDEHYSGEASGAVWIVESPANSIWWKRKAVLLEENSAIFPVDHYDSPQSAIIAVIDSILVHYSDWESISITGIDESTLPVDDLDEVGRLVVQNGKAMLYRT